MIQNFYDHRNQFEQLRAMLRGDKRLTSVAKWEVETTEVPFAAIPSLEGFSQARFQEYLTLLKSIHAGRASNHGGAVCFGMWVSGFAGDTRHINVCSLTVAPANQVASLKPFYKSPKPRRPVYRHIEGDWYIWADW